MVWASRIWAYGLRAEGVGCWLKGLELRGSLRFNREFFCDKSEARQSKVFGIA